MTASSDLVAELREYGFETPCCHDAADEIERLYSLAKANNDLARRLEADKAALGEARDDEIQAAYVAGATATHDWWAAGNVEREADFTEAASDYARATLAKHGCS